MKKMMETQEKIFWVAWNLHLAISLLSIDKSNGQWNKQDMDVYITINLPTQDKKGEALVAKMQGFIKSWKL